mgnify:CR=1 FL=1
MEAAKLGAGGILAAAAAPCDVRAAPEGRDGEGKCPAFPRCPLKPVTPLAAEDAQKHPRADTREGRGTR